jgi:hypothetical protein
MDGTRFDNLIKRLAATPVTRATALRGLAAGAATLAGVTLLAEPSAAADGDGKRRRRRRVCDCSSADPNTCTNRRLRRRAARRLLRSNDCAYKGRCQTGVSGCALVVGCSPANNTRGSCPAGQVCNTRAICVPASGECGGACIPGEEICCPPGSTKAGTCKKNLNACNL